MADLPRSILVGRSIGASQSFQNEWVGSPRSLSPCRCPTYGVHHSCNQSESAMSSWDPSGVLDNPGQNVPTGSRNIPGPPRLAHKCE